MEEARKKLRLCLLLVVTAAVIIGAVYYFNDVKNSGDMSGGTLVKRIEESFRADKLPAGRV